MLYVNPLERLAAQGHDVSDDQRKQVAFKELEKVFTYMLVKEMRNTVPDDGLFGNSPMSRAFKDFMDDAIAQEWANSGQLGLAEQMQREHDIALAQRQLGARNGPTP